MDEEWLNAPMTEEDVLGRQEREAKAETGYQTAHAAAKTAGADVSTLEKEWSDYLADQEKGVQRTGDKANPYGLPQDLWTEARQTADRQWGDVSKNVQAHGAPKLGDIQGQFGEGLLTPESGRDAEEAYAKAMQEWQSDQRLGLYDTAQRGAAEELLDTPPSVQVDAKTGAPSPIYDFGGTDRENAGVARMAGTLRGLMPFGGGGEYEVRSLSPLMMEKAQRFDRSQRAAASRVRREGGSMYNKRHRRMNWRERRRSDELLPCSRVGAHPPMTS